jgi:hypothetical protein
MRHQTAWGFKNGKDNKLGFGYSIVLSPGYGSGMHLFVITALAGSWVNGIWDGQTRPWGNWKGVSFAFLPCGHVIRENFFSIRASGIAGFEDRGITTLPWPFSEGMDLMGYDQIGSLAGS